MKFIGFLYKIMRIYKNKFCCFYGRNLLLDNLWNKKFNDLIIKRYTIKKSISFAFYTIKYNTNTDFKRSFLNYYNIKFYLLTEVL